MGTQKLISMVEDMDKKPKYNDFDEENIESTITKEDENAPKELSKRALKRQKQKLKKLEELKAKEGRAAKAAEHRETTHATEDVVEAMIFSDSDGEIDLPKSTIKTEVTETKMKNQTFKTKKKKKKNIGGEEEKVISEVSPEVNNESSELKPMKKKKNKGSKEENTVVSEVSQEVKESETQITSKESQGK